MATKKQSKAQTRKPNTDPSMVIIKDVKGNPRKEGSLGFQSFSLIKSGMTVAKFVELGGRMKDLQWDILAGNLHLDTKKIKTS